MSLGLIPSTTTQSPAMLLIPELRSRCVLVSPGGTCLKYEVVIQGEGGTTGNAIPADVIALVFDLVLVDPLRASSLRHGTIVEAELISGVGLPGGFSGPPSQRSRGPYTGLVYPFRDNLNQPGTRFTRGFIPGGMSTHRDNGTVSSNGAALYGVCAAMNVRRFPPRAPSYRGNPNTGFDSSGRSAKRVFFVEIELASNKPRELALHMIPALDSRGWPVARVMMSDGTIVAPRTVAPSFLKIPVRSGRAPATIAGA